MKRIMSIISILLILFVSIAAESCNNSTKQQGRQRQEKTMQSAKSKQPVPEVDHFLTRKYVKEYMERVNQPQKTWYIYILSNTGSFVGYHVAKCKPISVGTYLYRI